MNKIILIDAHEEDSTKCNKHHVLTAVEAPKEETFSMQVLAYSLIKVKKKQLTQIDVQFYAQMKSK